MRIFVSTWMIFIFAVTPLALHVDSLCHAQNAYQGQSASFSFANTEDRGHQNSFILEEKEEKEKEEDEKESGGEYLPGTHSSLHRTSQDQFNLSTSRTKRLSSISITLCMERGPPSLV